MAVRGWIGIGCLIFGVIMMIAPTTRPVSFLVVGFGLGMISTGFQ
jgi:hypothetical protein